MSSLATKAVAIGASAGALDALAGILPHLPENYPVSVMVVVHLLADRPNPLVALLQPKCKLPIKEAEDKEPALAGTVYLAPAGYHLLIEENKHLSLSNDDPVSHARPSIDVLFEAAADAYGPDLTGVVLTGANSDGAKGLKAIAGAGGMALVQDPAHSYAAAMPQAALKECPCARALSLAQIATHLREITAP
ncbi:MAG: chemotaxis protein CheB [Pseudomonadota bacterium]|nr:chemotaxis protein CheB [Pseudomonadota bacterium]